MPAIVIDIDECKKNIPGYTPTNAAKYHTESAKLADKLFKDAISFLVAVIFELSDKSENFGMATAAKIPRVTIIITSSVKVNPF